MKVITLWQPWASFISLGWKTIETRTHKRFEKLKGSYIYIHAGKKYDKDWRYYYYGLTPSQQLIIDELIYKKEIPFGQIICSAYVSDFRLLSGVHSQQALIDCEHTRRYGLFLKDITPELPTIPINGQRGIWNFTSEGNS